MVAEVSAPALLCEGCQFQPCRQMSWQMFFSGCHHRRDAESALTFWFASLVLMPPSPEGSTKTVEGTEGGKHD